MGTGSCASPGPRERTETTACQGHSTFVDFCHFPQELTSAGSGFAGDGGRQGANKKRSTHCTSGGSGQAGADPRTAQPQRSTPQLRTGPRRVLCTRVLRQVRAGGAEARGGSGLGVWPGSRAQLPGRGAEWVRAASPPAHPRAGPPHLRRPPSSQTCEAPRARMGFVSPKVKHFDKNHWPRHRERNSVRVDSWPPPRRQPRRADIPVGGRGPAATPRPPATPAERSLTQGEAHQAVGEEAGSQEGGPQRDVQLLSDLGLHPHEQAGRETGAQPGGRRGHTPGVPGRG